MRVMVIGASTNRDKFGNKAVRAYQRQGHEVVPINPKAEVIEGITCYHTVSEAPGPIDRASVYLPPALVLEVLDDLAARGDVGELWLNPGSESPEVIEKAKELGFDPITACSIVDIGERP
ncbi:MAG: CoA-binding protein [Planctomycetes bacterium]|nr:CoA-binding protein [Planctomycetota bacterium]NOG53299.1 CoA-binding protein [Planctomycetota bacterium]